MSWLTGVVRQAFFAIDTAVYGAISSLYNFLLDLAKVQIFSESVIQEFASRIYAFLGVIMIFKLTVSMVQYVAAPEKLETDGKKLVVNIIISLILMVILPGIVFPLATELQNAVLEDGIIEQTILGVDPTGEAGRMRKQGGRLMAYVSFSTFFYPAPCEGEAVFVSVNGETQLTEACKTAINEGYGSGVSEDFEEYYIASYQQKNMKMLSEWVSEKNSDKEFLMNYNFGLSTIVGAVVLFILFRFCFDVALRAVKLGFLQLIAPIPIISYADPKSKKNFDGYIKEYVSTYLSLFVRLAALYFAIAVISMVANGNLYYIEDGDVVAVTSFWVQLFVIIGCLMFATEIPKLLENVMGVKGGSFSLNPFKSSPLANAVVGGGVAGLAAGLTNTATGLVAGYNQGKGNGFLGGVRGALGRGITSGIGGAFGAGSRAVAGGMKGTSFGKNIWGAHQTAMFAKQQREDLYRQAGAHTMGEKARFFGKSFMADRARNVGVMNAAQAQQLAFDREDKRIKSAKANADYRKTQATAGYKEYGDLLKQAEARISQDKRVRDAQKDVDKAMATGDEKAINLANKKMDVAKMLAGKDYFNSSESQAVRDRLQEIRNNNTHLQDSRFDYMKASGALDKAAMTNIDNELWNIEHSFDAEYEQLANAERELARRKTDASSNGDYGDWDINDLANKSRSVKGPQPESWMPNGEISGSYGPQYPGGLGPGPGRGPGGHP